jgi:hypothetical protein
MKIRAFWDTTLCNPVGVHRRYRGVYCVNHERDYRPDDGGSTHL